MKTQEINSNKDHRERPPTETPNWRVQSYTLGLTYFPLGSFIPPCYS
jgi:hypothetical protein